MRTWAVIVLLLVLLLPALASGAPTAPPGAAPAADPSPLPLPPVAVQPDLRDAVYGDFLLVGNSSLRCPVAGEPEAGNPVEQCAAATRNALPGGLLDTSANNNGYYMRLADDDGRTDTFTASRAEVTIPSGARVRHARLNWGGHTGTFLGFSGVNCVRPVLLQGEAPPPPAKPSPAEQDVGIAVAGGAPTRVTRVREHYRTTEGLTEPSQVYTDWADVTAHFDQAPTGRPIEVSVSNVWAPTGPGCAGGWSLVVVYDHGRATPDHPTPRVVDFYSGTLPQGGALLPGLLEPLVPGFPTVVDGLLPGLVPELTGTRVVLSGVTAQRASADVAIGVTAFDGDWRQGGETFTVDGVPITEPCLRDGAEDFFRSCAVGAIGVADPAARPGNNLSVDAKTVRPTLADNDTGAVEIGVNSVADFVVLSSVVLAETVAPGIEVTNTGPAEPVREGDLAQFTIGITNTGALPLTDLRVDSASEPPGAEIRCAPAVLPPLDPGATTQALCVQAAAADPIVNRTTVTGTYLVSTDGQPRTVDATAEATAEVVPADYAVRRVPDRLTVRAGQPVRFAVTLINNTDRDLSQVSYSDEATADCSPAPAVLPARRTAALECVLARAVETFTSRGTMTGVDTDGSTVPVHSQSVTVAVIEPTAALAQRADPDTVYRGKPVTMTFTVTNTGAREDGPLFDAVVTADALPDCATEPVPALAPGESAAVTCTTKPARTVEVTAVVTAVDSSGATVTAEAEPVTVTVLTPLLKVEQRADPTTVRVGGEITFTFTATNVGDTADGPLSEVAISNPTLPPDCAPEVIQTLPPGASETRVCTATPDRSFTSVTTADATDQSGRPMTVTAEPLPITVINPAMTIDVAADPPRAQHGAPVDFTVTLRNIGDVDLTLTVENDHAPDCDLALTASPGLRAGAAQGMRCQVVLPTAEADTEFTNTAAYTAAPVPETGDRGEPLTGDDVATVALLRGQAPDAPSPGPDPANPTDGVGGGGTPRAGAGTGSTTNPATGSPGTGLATTGASVAAPLALGLSLLILGSLALAATSRREDSFLKRWWPGN